MFKNDEEKIGIFSVLLVGWCEVRMGSPCNIEAKKKKELVIFFLQMKHTRQLSPFLITIFYSCRKLRERERNVKHEKGCLSPSCYNCSSNRLRFHSTLIYFGIHKIGKRISKNLILSHSSNKK